MNQLVIIGAGGQGVEAAWVASEMRDGDGKACWDVLGFADDAPELRGKTVSGRKVPGTVEWLLREQAGKSTAFHCGIGDNAGRKCVAEKVEAGGFVLATIVAPTAMIAPNARILAGVYIAHGVYIGPEATLGRCALVNVHASVGHHTVTGDFAQYCPGARVSGACQVDEGAFLGSNAVLAPGVKMGAWASLGAASFAARDIEAGATMLGNPARRLI